jgi:hypothetical protein
VITVDAINWVITVDAIKKEHRNFNWLLVGLDVNAEKTKYMLLPRHQNSGHINDIR